MIAEWAGNSGLSWMCPGLPVSKLPNVFAFPYWHLRRNLSQSELSLPPLLYVLLPFRPHHASWSPLRLQLLPPDNLPPPHHHHSHSHQSQLSPGLWQPLPVSLLASPVSANVSYKLWPCYLPLGAALVMLLFKNLASGRVPVHHVPNSAWCLIRNISLL